MPRTKKTAPEPAETIPPLPTVRLRLRAVSFTRDGLYRALAHLERQLLRGEAGEVRSPRGADYRYEATIEEESP